MRTKPRRRPLPIPQHEFGFTPDAFNLMQDTAPDGDRLASALAEAQTARQRADQAQTAFFNPPSSTLHPR